MTRPNKARKTDRIVHPGVSPEEMRCDMATAPFDRVTRDMERTWGIDRLPELVSVNTAEKWGAAIAKLNSAIAANDPEEVKSRVEVCIRGYAAMDAEARAAGHQPSDPAIWEYEYEGHRFGIIADGREWPAAYAKRPGLTIYTMQEVAIALRASKAANPVIEAVKQHFPGGYISDIRELIEAGGDELPF